MLITQKYLEEQRRLHAEDQEYACNSGKWAYLVTGIALIERCVTVFDYGCGKGELAKEIKRIRPPLPFTVLEYDPAVEGKDRLTNTADLVTCLDVMEHIEPECLHEVMLDLVVATKKLLFVVISCKFTKRRWLSDGRNSHLIVNPGEWWHQEFAKYGFEVKRTWNTGVKEWVALMDPPHA